MIDTIVKSFDIWTDAQGIKSKGRVKSIENIRLEGIQSLRKVIIDLAIQGLLVPQDPIVDSAKGLLLKNTEVKNKLIEEGIIKKTKRLPKIDEVGWFEKLPIGWAIEYLQEISFLITKGSTPTSYGYEYTNSGVRFVKVENIERSRITTNGKSEFIDLATHDFLQRSKLEEGDILFSIAGTIGKTCVVRKEDLPANTNQALAIIRGTFIVFNPEFLLIQLDSFVSNKIKEKARGGAMNNISLGDLNELILYIPPLAEQHHIVAKVDELMTLCDRLEAEQFNNLNTHQALVKTLLETLTQAADANKLQAAWARMSAHFDTLFCTADSVDQLKQTVLQLAVMGKLVKQDPKDEPASELLKRIEKEIGNKKGTAVSEIKENEKPFALPEGWEWIRLQQIIQISSGDGLISTNMNSNGNIPVYGGNGINGYHDKGNISKPTLVIGRVGYYCGSLHVTPGLAWVTDNAFITSFSENNIYLNFLYWLLKATNLKEHDSATAQPVISGRKVYPIVVALAPLAEQKRIVAKIEELFALSESLKERVEKAQDIKVLLSKTILEKAVQ